MYPSQIEEWAVVVDYPIAGAPVLNPAPGDYSDDQLVTLSSGTAGATIYYTIAPGMGGAPAPVPGQAGTQQYSGPIPVAGAGTTLSIAAIAVAPESKQSTVSSGVYTIGFEGNAESPVFSLGDGFQANGSVLSITTASTTATVYYTYTIDGTEPTDPVPGDQGTQEYSVPLPLSFGDPPQYRQRYRFKALATGGDFLPGTISMASFDVVPAIPVTRGDDPYPTFSAIRTLREAVMAANSESGWWDGNRPAWADTAEVVLITFDANINGGNPFTISLEDINPDRGLFIGRSLVIAGHRGDPSHVTLSTNEEFRHFHIGDPANPNLFVQFQDITIADGLAHGRGGLNGPENGSAGGGGAGAGGAIYVAHGAALSLERVIMRDNTARGGNGGAYGALLSGVWGAAGASGGGGAGFGGVYTSSGNGGTTGGLDLPGGVGGSGSWLAGGGGGGSARTEPGAGGAGGFGGGGGGGGGRRLSSLGAPGGTGGQFGGDGGRSDSSGTSGGGGGAGLGGAVFVESGTLSATDSIFESNAAVGGSRGASYDGSPASGHGEGQGGAIFTYQGSQYQDGGGNVFLGNVGRDGSGSSNGESDVYEM